MYVGSSLGALFADAKPSLRAQIEEKFKEVGVLCVECCVVWVTVVGCCVVCCVVR